MVLVNTNAVIQQGGGAGDTVYAVNQTGKELVAGDKVWLNTTTSENIHSQNFNPTDKDIYTVGNKMFSNGKFRFDWNGEQFVLTTISTSELPSDASGYVGAIQYRDGIRFSSAEMFGANNCIITDDGLPQYLIKPSNVKYIRQVLNKKYCIVDDASNWYVRKYDYTTGKIEDTNIATLKGSSANNHCYYCLEGDNRQFAYIYHAVTPKQFFIKDDIEKGINAITVNMYLVAESNFYPVFFTNGFNVGSYCIASAQTNTFRNYKPLFYKFYEDTFRPADDLPESLASMLNANVYFDYNNETKILTTSYADKSEIHIYKLGDDNLFHEIELDIELPTYRKYDSNRFTRVVLSDDATTLLFAYYNGASSPKENVQAYKLNFIDGKWRATTSVECTEQTLTGFATGNVNEAGENEISTVLPPKVTLTFNVTPDPDTLEFKGIVA